MEDDEAMAQACLEVEQLLKRMVPSDDAVHVSSHRIDT